MKCPQCGLVTFDDLPQCPRCKESFALVRPLASSSLDGARHFLRDDPELRVELRDRLHRARLDRRKENENPLAAGADPDAPDWFEPEPAEVDEAVLSMAASAAGPSKEGEIVSIDDLSPDDDIRGGAATADGEVDIVEASREDDDAAPEFDGEIPGFTDWREELRERLKRIRERREQERLAGDAEDAAVADDDEVAVEEAAAATPEVEEAAPEAVADPEEAPEEIAAEAAEPEDAFEETATEAPEERRPTAGDLIAQLVDGDAPMDVDSTLDFTPPSEADGDIDFTMDGPVEVVDTDAGAEEDAESPDVLILGEREAEVDEVDSEEVELEASDASTPDDEPAMEFDIVDDAEPEQVDEPVLMLVEDEPAPEPADDETVEELAALEPAEEEEPIEATASQSPDDDADAIEGLALHVDDVIVDGADTIEAAPEAEEVVVIEADETEAVEVDEPLTEEPVVEELAAEESVSDEPFAEESPDEDLSADDVLVLDDVEPPTLEEMDLATAEEAAEEESAGFDWGDATATSDATELATEAGEADDDPLAGLELHEEPAATEPDTSIGDLAEEFDAAEEISLVEATDEALAEEPDSEAELPAAIMPDEAPADVIMPDVIMPDAPTAEPAVELDFEGAEEVLPAAASAPELDVSVDEDDAQDLEWDAEPAAAKASSSAAPLGERAAAALCDALVLTVIAAALVGAASSGTGVPFGQILAQEAIWLGLAWAIFAAGYSIFFVGSCGQTIGRMIMRLRVISEDQFTVGFDRAAIRLAAWVVSALPLFAGMIPAIKDPEHRAAHDRLSKTRVVKA